MKPVFTRRIGVQIAMYSLVAGLITLFLIGSILYFSLSNIILDESISNTETAIEKSGDYIDLYIRQLKATSLTLAENPDTLAYFVNTKEEDLIAENNVLTMVDSIMKGDSSIKSIILVGKDGRIISNEESLHMSKSKDMMNETWYVDAIHNDMPVLTSARMQHFSMDKDNWVISLSREIKDNQGNNIGVLLLDIDYTIIEDYLADLDLGNKGCAFILNGKDQVVYHKQPEYFTNDTLRQELVAQKEIAMGYNASKGQLATAFSLDHADWTLVGISSLDGLAHAKRQVIEVLLFASLLLFIGVAFSGTFFARRITDPINRLEKAMTDLEDGLKEVEVMEKGSFEAQSLAKHFNKMVHRIQDLMTDIQNKESSLRSYELKVLHSQINPHFLYNTLDTIVWMAEFDDSQKVIAITKALAQFFRLSLSGGKEVTTVSQEFDHVRQYLFIQKERYGDLLEYELSMDEDLVDIKIPKIILQPMVENAIYHGIRNLPEGGTIWVTAEKEDGKLVFTIQDDGKGFDCTKEEQKEETEHTIKLGGVGLKNVDKRIKLYYGSSYGVNVVSEPGKGTIVTITLGLKMS